MLSTVPLVSSVKSAHSMAYCTHTLCLLVTQPVSKRTAHYVARP
jgi:hypothetical protein